MPRSATHLSETPRSSQTNRPERRTTEGVRTTFDAPAPLTQMSALAWLVYLEAAICCDTQAVAGATEMFRHGGDEAHLPCEAWHFKHLLGDRDKCQTQTLGKIPHFSTVGSAARDTGL